MKGQINKVNYRQFENSKYLHKAIRRCNFSVCGTYSFSITSTKTHHAFRSMNTWNALKRSYTKTIRKENPVNYLPKLCSTFHQKDKRN